jgi:Mg-chelatase subunit ChlD
MFFLNLSATEFFAVLGALSGLISLLYLLDRSKRKKVVSTLRFWTPARSAQGQQSRKRMREPWSLILQLLALLLLLLAIAQLQWGTRERRGSDHVLLLDTSAWAAQRAADGAGTVLQREKALAKRYLNGLPKRDRALIARADSLTTPSTSFTNNKSQLNTAIDDITAGSSALNLDQALKFAKQAQNWSGGQAGEIIYIGPEVTGDDPADLPAVTNLRTIAVNPVRENVGIRRLGVRRDQAEANGWQASIAVKNYGAQPQSVRLQTQFAGSLFQPRLLHLTGGQEVTAEYKFTTNGAGNLDAKLEPGDGLPMDDQASIHLPKAGSLRLAVFTSRPAVLRPLLEADRRLSVHYFAPAEYTAKPAADIVLLDEFSPKTKPGLPSLWINPPRDSSPLAIKEVASDVSISSWNEEAGISQGLHAKEARIPHAEIFQAFEGDTPIASSKDGPLVVTRPGSRGDSSMALIGFDPMSGPLRFEVTTPLLFAHLLKWLSPGSMRDSEFVASRLGALTLPLDATEQARDIQVADDQGAAVPFTVHDKSINLFASRPGVVRVMTPERQRIVSLTLPDIAEHVWKPRAEIASGVPSARFFSASSVDLWKFLAAAAALLLVGEWWLFGRSRRTGWQNIPLLLKVAGVAAIVIALFQPHITVPGTRTGTVVLVDTSNSITRDDMARASSIASEIASHRGSNWLKIVPFAGHVRPLEESELTNGVHLVRTSNESGDATNFESAISDSLSAVPAGYIPRLLLISDGNENQGSTARAIAELQRLHVPVDTIALTGRPAGGLHLESVTMPPTAYAGEQIPIDVTFDSPSAASGKVEISAEGKSLGSGNVDLQAGKNTLRLHARVKSSGAAVISGRISANGLGEADFEQAVTLAKARVLFISEDTPESDANILKAFDEAGFEVVRDSPSVATDLSGIQLAVVNNIDLNTVPSSAKLRLAQYVRDGGGLLLIGGERQIYKEDKRLDALDDALPAKLAPPKTPEGTCVALIIDKSSSMEGRKIELARLSAIGVVDHLQPTDSIGVLIFDNSFQWAVPMRRAEDKSLIKRLISGIVPDGGTQIAPALAEAYRKVAPSKATYKHIVLLTDGISEEGDSLDLAKQAAEHQVTISTVGLGQDVNRAYLEKVADVSGGKSYFLNEPRGLEQILLKDVQDYSGSTAVERPMTPVVDRQAEILEGLDMKSAPALQGYARFTAKPDAETILSIDPQKKDPLYVRWQYGLGRAAVFSSDAKSRWAQAWVTWPGFDKFWINVSRDLLNHSRASDASVDFDSANNDLVVNYRLSNEVPEPAKVPEIFVIGSDHFEKPIAVQRVTARVYQGRLHIGQAGGLFRIRPVAESRAFPEVGFYRQQGEMRDNGANEALLRQISVLTGGHVNPAPASVFDSGGRTLYNTMQLWPLLLGLAITLTLAELVARKWKGLITRFRNA